MTRSDMNKHAEAIRPHWIEWVTGILSTLLVLSMIAWVTWEALSHATNRRTFRHAWRASNPQPPAGA